MVHSASTMSSFVPGKKFGMNDGGIVEFVVVVDVESLDTTFTVAVVVTY